MYMYCAKMSTFTVYDSFYKIKWPTHKKVLSSFFFSFFFLYIIQIPLDQHPLKAHLPTLRFMEAWRFSADFVVVSQVDRALRLDNTGAWVIEVYPSLLCNRMSENVDLYIK